MPDILTEIKALEAATAAEHARVTEAAATASSLTIKNALLKQKCQSLADDCEGLRKALVACLSSAEQQFDNTDKLRAAVQDLAKARTELTSERQAAAAVLRKQHVLQADAAGEQAALQRCQA
ncbi:hypothetical protein WJX81_000694 [Elliptochloris bilobata]|uniref:Uncharacterized protein n=1 Tax=Elliptochloris bilobata TaxID=381761 RepID=A0AAW1QNH2_9CHLO